MIRNGNISESRDVDLDGLSIHDVESRLSEASEGLSNVTLNIELEYSYGDSWVRSFITGWRPATPVEIAADQAERNRAANQERERQNRLAERLKQERPDLF